MPIYYPSVAARLVVRFDEALLKGDTPDGSTPEDGAEAAAIAAALPLDPAANAGLPSKAPLLLNNSSPDGLTHSLAIVPMAASFELPTFRQAPKFSVTFAYRDFPVDPRAIRAASVELYLGTVSGDGFARGMLGQLDGGRLASQLVLNNDNLMLVGVADTMVSSHDEKGSSVVMTGRGLQGMLLDAKCHADQLAALNLKQNIKAVIEQLLGMDAQSKKIPVRVADGTGGTTNEWPNGVPSPADQSLVSRVNKGQGGNSANLPMKGNANEVAIWDVISNLCSYVGAVPYFVANNLWIRPSRGIFEQKAAGQSDANPTPFANGKPRIVQTTAGDISVAYRKMVFGRNILNYKIERKFGGAKVPTVQVVSYDPDSTARGDGRHLQVEWPPADKIAARRSAVDPSGAESRTEPLRVSVPGIVDKNRLLSIAKQIYEEVGRGELGGSVSTKDLASLGGNNADADILRLRPGDAVEFAADAGGLESFPPVVSELNNKAAQAPAELSATIQKRLGFSKSLADVLAGTAKNQFASLQNVFRVANVSYSWAIDSGVAVDFDFQNYVTARYDIEKNNVASAITPEPGASKTSTFGSATGTTFAQLKKLSAAEAKRK